MKLFLLLAWLLILSMPLRASQSEDSLTTVSLHAIPGLQYDLVQFKVKPGARVKIVFTNRDDMSHNLVITKPAARLLVVNAALKLEEKGPAMDYIPVSSDVLWSIPVVSPGKEKSIVFTAPTKLGAYPYVCTFPGHGFVMYGVMYVTADEHLPDLANDLNIPPTRRQANSTDSSGVDKNHALHAAKTVPAHPYEPTPPYLYRVYMEDASPAAIAVNLPHELSYCWDAGTCQLRYAWQGGFVDNTAVWKGKPNAVAKILGPVFFRQTTIHPLRIGSPEEIPLTAFRGYQLINRYPEFHYTLDGIDVYELIQSKADGTGIVRTFRVPHAAKSVWLYIHPEDGMKYECSLGKWEKNRLMLSPSQAREFSVVMTKSAK